MKEDGQDSPKASADHPGGVRAEGARGPRTTIEDGQDSPKASADHPGGVRAEGARTTIKVLGVDPGTQRTGWGIVEVRGSRLVGIEAGVVRADASLALAVRLQRIYDGLTAILERFAPDEVAVESIFHAKYASAAIKLGHVRGVALLAAANARLPVHDYAPALVKRTVGGHGSADKRQLAAIVGTILGWTSLPSADATDALAVAITHAQAARFAKATSRIRT